jgi:isopenicillin N synthase-like dioxygenase
MTTSFSSLPIVDLSILSSPSPSEPELKTLSNQLQNVFATTGFAYLTNAPLTFSHDDVFKVASDFFSIEDDEKARLAKKTFVQENNNTYRGYFPPQPGQLDNLKEGFEVGPPLAPKQLCPGMIQKFNLAEPNVWPSEEAFRGGRARLETLYIELQSLSLKLLSLLAVSLDKPVDFFSDYLVDSISTMRLLHYPPQPSSKQPQTDEVRLCCTPHTDSGILTLLHQDPTGGLEVLNASGDWVPAPYVPNSLVVNIGDLLAKVSSGRFVATKHRVRTNEGGASRNDGMGRFSVPFFFEPGENCVVKSLDGGESVLYGEHVRKKMGTWVEFQNLPDEPVELSSASAGAVEVY